MRKIGIQLVASFAVLCYAPQTLAFVFGSDENVHAIQDIEGTDYRLCHKTTLHSFGAGIYLTDDGYVLQERGAYSSYIPLEDAEILALQSEGLLPDPLPEYSIPVLDYVLGYSLWVLIAFAIVGTRVGPVIRDYSDGRRITVLLATPHYKEALRIALNSGDDGINRAVDYLQAKNEPLELAQSNMQLLLSKVVRTSA